MPRQTDRTLLLASEAGRLSPFRRRSPASLAAALSVLLLCSAAARAGTPASDGQTPAVVQRRSSQPADGEQAPGPTVSTSGRAFSPLIQARRLSVGWNPTGRSFQLAADGKVFATLRFPGAEASAEPRRQTWRHERLGAGRALELRLAKGELARVVVLPDLPFVLVQRELANPGQKDVVLNRVRPFDLTVQLGVPPSQLKALGTAGLTDVDGHPGSYAFLAVASPKSRRGVVCGWLSHDRGSGVLFSRSQGEAVHIQPQIDYGCLRIRPGQTACSELLAVGLFDDARVGLEAYADGIARYYHIRLRPILCGYCTWYSRPYGGAGDEVHLRELAAACEKQLKPFGFDFIQIDDKWQAGQRRNGPAKNFYTHNPDGPYPSGMKAAADNLRSHGFIPGIWFMPFAGDRQDPFFLQHTDWFVKRKDGTPFWSRWGGTSLDMTHPGAREYLRSVVHRLAHEWGYRYFKMDGLYVGTATKQIYINDGYRGDDELGEAVFHNPDKTNIEAFRDGLKLVRQAAGPDVFFLGCCVSQNMRSFGGSFGLVDAMRIGPDNGPRWQGLLRGPWHGTNRYFLHGRVWYNDPDPVYVRPSVPLEHAQTICSWVAVTGCLTVFSEWLPGLPDERVELLRRILPNHGLNTARPVDLFEQPLARIWHLPDTRRSPRRDVVALFNWDDKKPSQFDYPTDRLGLPPASQYVAFEYWTDRLVGPFSKRLRLEVPAGSCRVLAVRPTPDHPVLLSTSRHVTQGIVDVLEERWDENRQTLSGRSRLVAGDPYELRLYVPPAARGRTVVRAEARPTGSDTNGSVHVTVVQSRGPLVRVRLLSESSGEVSWQIQFAR